MADIGKTYVACADNPNLVSPSQAPTFGRSQHPLVTAPHRFSWEFKWKRKSSPLDALLRDHLSWAAAWAA